MDIFHTEGGELLIKALLSLENEQECIDFLEDLLTTKEMLDMSQRMVVAKLLSEDNVYNKIVAQTGASSATVTRVNRSYKYGNGGYKKVLSRIK